LLWSMALGRSVAGLLGDFRWGTHVGQLWRRAGRKGPRAGHGLDNRGHGSARPPTQAAPRRCGVQRASPNKPCHATPRRHPPPASTHAPACCACSWVGRSQPSHRLLGIFGRERTWAACGGARGQGSSRGMASIIEAMAAPCRRGAQPASPNSPATPRRHPPPTSTQ